MDKEKSPAGSGEYEKAYCAIETAAIRLSAGAPIFYEFKEIKEYNERFRKELVQALLLALDLFIQNGLSVERSALLEKVRCEST